MECPHCNLDFLPQHHAQKFCCAECRQEATRIRTRERMRETRGSYAPHVCLGCDVILIGRALRCPNCLSAERKRIHRDSKRREAEKRKDEVNAMRRQRRLTSGAQAREKDRERDARRVLTPEQREKRRESYRRYAARKRQEKEIEILKNLADGNHTT